VVLVGLDYVEVRTLTLGEAVLAIKLKLGGDNWVLTPAMHVKGSLGKNESSGIREQGLFGSAITIDTIGPLGAIRTSSVSHSTLESSISTDESSRTRGSIFTTEGMDSVGKSINGISVVERLGTKSLVKSLATFKGLAVVYVSIRLDNPDKLLTGVVEVELDLVGGGTDRLVASELELRDEVLMGVLCESTTLIGVEEDVVNIEGSSNQGLVV
jgi:hypothetical protein